MGQRNWTRWLFEGALIVFSVLLALVINEAVDRRKTGTQARVAIERIALELDRNQKILSSWQERHSAMGHRLGEIAADSESPLRSQLFASGFLDLGVVTGQESFIDATLADSAWAAAQATGLAGEFDYETVQQLAATYALQHIVNDQTIKRFVAVYFDRESHRPENFDSTITQFRLVLGELVGQEITLSQRYSEALEQLNRQ
jgi:hypothetical protein